MRYEHIDLNLSMKACALLLERLGEDLLFDVELANLQNELRARLQRRDVDVQCPKNAPTEDWLTT